MTAPDPGDRVLVEAEVVRVGPFRVRTTVGWVSAEWLRPWHPPLPEGMTSERLRGIAGLLNKEADYRRGARSTARDDLRAWADALAHAGTTS